MLRTYFRIGVGIGIERLICTTAFCVVLSCMLATWYFCFFLIWSILSSFLVCFLVLVLALLLGGLLGLGSAFLLLFFRLYGMR